MKKFLKGLALLIGLMLIIAAGFFIYAARGRDKDNPPEGRSAAKLEVVVENRKIATIIIIDDLLLPSAEFSQGIIKNILEAQQTDTDVVTGSTVTSRAYLKAVRNALDPQKEETR